MSRALTRRRFLREGGTAALGLALAPAWRLEAAPAFDLVLKGGTLLDGTGAVDECLVLAFDEARSNLVGRRTRRVIPSARAASSCSRSRRRP